MVAATYNLMSLQHVKRFVSHAPIRSYGLTNAQQLALGLDPFSSYNPALPTVPTPDPTDHTPPVITLTIPDGSTLLP